MKWTRASSTGVSVKVDVEGRIYLPSDLRAEINLDSGEQLQVFITQQNDILLRRSTRS
ncbi:MAG: AbrB/MazE/SpoVT family DNA-binding domain-containing protein [Bacillota bacterium]